MNVERVDKIDETIRTNHMSASASVVVIAARVNIVPEIEWDVLYARLLKMMISFEMIC